MASGSSGGSLWRHSMARRRTHTLSGQMMNQGEPHRASLGAQPSSCGCNCSCCSRQTSVGDGRVLASSRRMKRAATALASASLSRRTCARCQSIEFIRPQFGLVGPKRTQPSGENQFAPRGPWATLSTSTTQPVWGPRSGRNQSHRRNPRRKPPVFCGYFKYRSAKLHTNRPTCNSACVNVFARSVASKLPPSPSTEQQINPSYFWFRCPANWFMGATFTR